MDKRYFFIIIIICVCCINLYMIANVSDVVGSASIHVGDYTFSLPDGFSLYDDEHSQIHIYNPDSDMDIIVYSQLGKNDTFLNKYNEINSSGKYNILSNGTLKDDDINIESLFYQRINDTNNRSTFYFTKFDHNFRILLTNFDYNTEKNEIMDIVTHIVDSLRINHEVTG